MSPRLTCLEWSTSTETHFNPQQGRSHSSHLKLCKVSEKHSLVKTLSSESVRAAAGKEVLSCLEDQGQASCRRAHVCLQGLSFPVGLQSKIPSVTACPFLSQNQNLL